MANDVPSIHLWSGRRQQEQVTMPLRSAVYAVDLLLVEDVPAGSSFAFVDAVEIDQWVEFAHLVDTLVAVAVVLTGVVGLVASPLASASGAAFVMDFDSFVSASAAVVDCIDH